MWPIKLNLFSCEYSHQCPGHQEDSYTCHKAVDKSYCGIYRRFLRGVTQ